MSEHENSDESDYESDDTIGDIESGINPGAFFKHDLLDQLMPLKWLKNKFDAIGKCKEKISKDNYHLFRLPNPEEFCLAAADPVFLKVLQLFEIELTEEQPNTWKIPSCWHHPTISRRSKFVEDLIRCNIDTKKAQFFDFKYKVEILKKLKFFFVHAKERSEHSIQEIALFAMPEITPELKKLLLCLELEFQEDGSWVLPKNLYESHDKKIEFVHELVICNIDEMECKVCHEQFDSVLKHLSKDKHCQESYPEEDVHDLREAAKARAKRKEKERKKKYRAKIVVEQAEYYQKNKAKLAKKYQEKKSEIRKQQSEYYESNWKRIGVTRAKYYQNNKEKYAQRYLKQKAQREEEKKMHNENQLFKKEKDGFELILKPMIERHKRNFQVPFLKMVTNYKNKCEEFHTLQIPRLDEIEQRIHDIYKLIDAKVVSTNDEFIKCSNSADAREIRKQFESFWAPLETDIEDNIYKSLKDIALIIEEEFDCPQCSIVSNFTANCYKCEKV